MTEICSVCYSSNQFQCVPRRQLVAEASDLWSPTRKEMFGRVYDDACDEGLKIRSERSGVMATFVVARTECDSEGDLRYWLLLPSTETLRRQPQLRGWTVVVYND